MARYSSTSNRRKNTCHPDLIVLADEVIKVHDATVVTGYRTEANQNQLCADGFSRVEYPDSNHNKMPSLAIDLAPYVPSMGGLTYDREYSLYFAGIVLGIADRLYRSGLMTHKIKWGGNWSTDRNKSFKTISFYDGLHFELVFE